MKTIKSFVFSICLMLSALFAGAADAVTVSVVPGKSIGLGDSFYWAGIVTLDIDGVEYPAMATNWDLTLFQNPSTTPDPWETTLWTQSEIEAGTASVYYAPEKYRVAAQLFLYALLGYDPADPLWTAGHNEMVWDTMSSPGVWEYGNRVYDIETGLTMYDVYTLTYLPDIDPNFDYSGFMGVLQGVGEQKQEFLVYTDISAIPVPPAIWLFGSGLVGLMAAARRRAAWGSRSRTA